MLTFSRKDKWLPSKQRVRQKVKMERRKSRVKSMRTTLRFKRMTTMRTSKTVRIQTKVRIRKIR